MLDPVRGAASSPLPAEPGNGSIALVTNCRVLGAGVDLPAVALVMLVPLTLARPVEHARP